MLCLRDVTNCHAVIRHCTGLSLQLRGIDQIIGSLLIAVLDHHVVQVTMTDPYPGHFGNLLFGMPHAIA
jgi:hypothetical protein